MPKLEDVAFHEAGHVIVAIADHQRLDHTGPAVPWVWISGRADRPGLTQAWFGRDPLCMTRNLARSIPGLVDEGLSFVRFTLGGIAAESRSSGKQLDVVRALHGPGDLSQARKRFDVPSGEVPCFCPDVVPAQLEEQLEAAVSIVEEHWLAVEQVAHALLMAPPRADPTLGFEVRKLEWNDLRFEVLKGSQLLQRSRLRLDELLPHEKYDLEIGIEP